MTGSDLSRYNRTGNTTRLARQGLEGFALKMAGSEIANHKAMGRVGKRRMTGSRKSPLDKLAYSGYYRGVSKHTQNTSMAISTPVKRNSPTQIEYKGDTLTITMLDSEAAFILQNDKSEFAQTLISRSNSNTLSTGQRFWLHKLAQDTQKTEQAPAITGLYDSVREMLSKASERLKYPSIRIVGEEKGQELKLSLAATGSKWEGFTFININKECVGTINQQGKFFPRSNCPEWVTSALEKFAAKPLETAKFYGQLTGRCCFCYRELTDKNSVELGYGPVCAENYGLA